MSKEYYASDSLNQSFLKTMYQSLSVINNYNTQGERNFNLKINDSMVTGSGVDCKITTPDEFDAEFILNNCKSPSDGIIKLFTHLRIYSKEHSHELQNLLYYNDVIKEYLDEIKYEGFGKSKGKFSTAIDKIYTEEEYWIFLMESKGKTILDPQRLNTINHATNVLLNHRFTKELFDYKCENQVWLELNKWGVNFKGLLDRVLINDTNKKHEFQIGISLPPKSITIIDIKTGQYRPENVSTYMKRWRVDLQLAFYTYLAKNSDKYKEFTVNNPLIVYTQNSTTTNYPSVKELTNTELNIGQYGKMNGAEMFYNTGVSPAFEEFGFEQCIDIYKFYLEKGWDIDWKLNMNNGLCNY